MAQKINIVIDQTASFSLPLVFTNSISNTALDFTNYTANSVIRKTYDAANSVPFIVSLSNNGVVMLSLTANTTAQLWPGKYVYDLDVTDNTGIVSRLVEGQVTVTPAVTGVPVSNSS